MIDTIGPQPGPQEAFMCSPADIVIYGGAAGGGKTFALLLEPIRNVSNPAFGAVIFRRESPQITNEGGLWDESVKLYPLLDAEPKSSTLEWKFPSGSTVSFGHMEHENDVLKWQGTQIPLIAFDELTHFSEKQFWYMLSRNRSLCGVKPYMRATCNPDPDSFVANLIAWWICQDQNSPQYGYPIPERAGVIRWFVRLDDNLHWADSYEELAAQFPDMAAMHAIKSLTFVPSRVEDNAILMAKNPEYVGNLLSLGTVDRERLHKGNWKVRPDAQPFKREKLQVAAKLPEGELNYQAFLDLAYTKKKKSDKTAWVVTATAADNRLYIVESGKRKMDGDDLVNFCFDLHAKYDACHMSGLHIEGHVIFNETTMPAAMRERNKFFPIVSLKHEGVSKTDRILSLDPAMKSIYFLPGNDELISELTAWTPASEIDDLSDALAYARKNAIRGRAPKAPDPHAHLPAILQEALKVEAGGGPRRERPKFHNPTRA